MPVSILLLVGVPGTAAAQTVRGQVVDSLTTAPLVNATVSLLDGEAAVVDQTIADDQGLFLIQVGSPGAYRVRVEFPLYQTSTFPEFSVEMGEVASFQLLVARDTDAEQLVRRSLCANGGGGSIVVGTVRYSATGEPVDGATIHYHLPAIPRNLASRIEYDVEGAITADTSGTYVFCDIPPYTPVSLMAATPDLRSEHASLMFLDEGVIDGGSSRRLSTNIYKRDLYLAPDSSWHGQLSAVVTDTTGVPVAGAHVRVVGSPLETRADPNGRFLLSGVPDGWVRLEIRYPGHRPVQLEAQLTGGRVTDSLPNRIVLDRLPVRLADIIVTARPGERRLVEEGFFDRQRWAQGSVVSINEYQRIHGRPSKVSDVLRTTRGIRVTPSGAVAVNRCTGPMALFINKMYLPPLLPPESVDYLIPVQDVVGVEVHTGIGIPPRFRRQRNQCAAVVIWTQ